MPMRKGLHFVRSASRNKKNPIDNLMKLYEKMIKTWRACELTIPYDFWLSYRIKIHELE